MNSLLIQLFGLKPGISVARTNSAVNTLGPYLENRLLHL